MRTGHVGQRESAFKPGLEDGAAPGVVLLKTAWGGRGGEREKGGVITYLSSAFPFQHTDLNICSGGSRKRTGGGGIGLDER